MGRSIPRQPQANSYILLSLPRFCSTILGSKRRRDPPAPLLPLMKHWGRRKPIYIATTSAALALTGMLVWFLYIPTNSDCAAKTPADEWVQTIHATKVIVSPWLGQHQIYGIFVVPNRYRDERRYATVLNVRGVTCLSVENGSAENRSEDEISGKPGYYSMRGYIPTRVALRVLFTGRFGDLRAPCNWALEFVKRAP